MSNIFQPSRKLCQSIITGDNHHAASINQRLILPVFDLHRNGRYFLGLASFVQPYARELHHAVVCGSGLFFALPCSRVSSYEYSTIDVFC